MLIKISDFLIRSRNFALRMFHFLRENLYLIVYIYSSF